MAALVLGIAGASLGGYFGGTVGASLGWMVGSSLGNILFGSSAPNQKITQEGSRLTDLKVQTSTYGNMIPIVYGTMRLAGNVIWATDIIETRHEDTQSQDAGGGKGGGGQTVEQTTITYTYAANLAVALCEGEIAGVRTIWANGKVIYNVAASNMGVTSSLNVTGGGTIRFYSGSETQNPDGLIQAYVGAANTPAFRGVAYVVFDNLQLQDFGNAIPNLTFEVCSLGNFNTAGVRIPTGGTFAHIVYNPADANVYCCDSSSGDLFKINLNLNSVVKTGNSSDLVNMDYWVFNPINGKLYAKTPSAYYNVDPTTFIVKFAWDANAFTAVGGYPNFVIDIVDTAKKRLYGSSVQVSMGVATSRLNVMRGDRPSNSGAIRQYQFGGNDIRLRVLDTATGYLWGDNSDASLTTPTHVGKFNVRSGSGQPGRVFDLPNTNVTAGNSVSMMIDRASHRLIIYYSGNSGNAYICQFDLGTETISSTTLVPGANGNNNPLLNTVERNVFYFNNSNKIVHFNIDTNTYALNNYPFTTFSNITNSAYDSNTDSELWGGVDSVIGTGLFRYLGYRLSPSNSSLASIVTDLCTRVNLTDTDIDVSMLTDNVTGYFISNISTVRACLQQLMQAFYFDATESDNKIKFVPRGQAAALTIDKDNLAARQYGDDLPDIVTVTRAQELDLPREVDIVYLNLNQNYEQGTQYSRRLDKQNKKIETVQFPIAMTPDKGKQIADVLLYDAWVGRTTYEFSTTLKYIALEPTDVIHITNSNTTYTVRITKKEQDTGLLKFNAVDETTAIYTQTNTGAPSIDPDNSIYFPSPTNMYFMDIPCLRDSDDGAGVYLAAAPNNPDASWRGAQIVKSVDDGNSYQEATTFFNSSVCGVASTVLGDFSGENVFDFKNSVIIQMVHGSLSDVSEIQALNGFNMALLGNEIIIFRDSELIDTDTYKLTCFLRGRFGTEQYISTHDAPEDFVLLNSLITRYSDTINDLNAPYLYKAITFGNDLFSSPNNTCTGTGVSLKPLTGVHIVGTRDVSLDLTIDWVRRTRIGGGWNDYTDVPLGEETQLYEVDILDGSTVVRTLTSTTPTVTYTAAEQTTDFGSPQSSVDIVIYQMSEIVGRGFGASATV